MACPSYQRDDRFLRGQSPCLTKSEAFFPAGNLTQKDSLPNYALLYFDNLTGEYQSLPADRVSTDDRAKVDALLVKRQEDKLAWNDVYSFDLIMARLQPLEKLPRVVWSLRNRYREVAGLREYDAYMASKPADEDANQPADHNDDRKEKALRADIEYLLGALHLRYSVRPVRERERDWLSKMVAYFTLAGLLWAVLFTTLINTRLSKIAFVNQDIPAEAMTFLVVLFLGAMGGLVSMQQRFQAATDEGDPIQNVSELAHGGFSLLLAPISGAVFAGILTLCFIGGLLTEVLFPKIDLPEATSLSLVEFLHNAGPQTGVEYAQLMVWAFIAGFAERLVPDTLSRFVAKKTAGESTDAPATGG